MPNQAFQLGHALCQTLVCFRAIQLFDQPADLACHIVDLADGIAGALILLDQASLLSHQTRQLTLLLGALPFQRCQLFVNDRVVLERVRNPGNLVNLLF
ncbi:hypothetical protein D3C85_1365840 [compost metagenome]